MSCCHGNDSNFSLLWETNALTNRIWLLCCKSAFFFFLQSSFWCTWLILFVCAFVCTWSLQVGCTSIIKLKCSFSYMFVHLDFFVSRRTCAPASSPTFWCIYILMFINMLCALLNKLNWTDEVHACALHPHQKPRLLPLLPPWLSSAHSIIWLDERPLAYWIIPATSL